MDDADIEYLKACMAQGMIVWICQADGKWARVISIGPAPKPKDPDDVPEPCDVAYISHRLGFYCALAAVGIEDVIVTSGNVANWPSQKETIHAHRNVCDPAQLA